MPPVAGIEPCSLIDYPGHIAAVVFLQGCNFDCGWCHNRQLIPLAGSHCNTRAFGPGTADHRQSAASLVSEKALKDFLVSRRDFLDGIVITGGEPTLHPGLGHLLELIKSHGYRIKLDTNGSQPDVLESLFDAELVDFVAMDLKAPLDGPARLADFCGVPVGQGGRLAVNLRTSLRLLQKQAPGGRSSPVSHEIRTTCSPGLVLGDLDRIAEVIAGLSPWALQVWRPPLLTARSGAPLSPKGPVALSSRDLEDWVGRTGSGSPLSVRS